MNKHNAPPVVYPVRSSSIEGGLWLAFWLAGLGVAYAWNRYSHPSVELLLVEVGLLGVTALRVFRVWGKDTARELIWDGSDWHSRDGTGTQDVELRQVVLVADLQRALMLQTVAQDGLRQWIWVERGMAPERWMDFRRALYGTGGGVNATRLLQPAKRKEMPHVAVSGSSNLTVEASQRPNHE